MHKFCHYINDCRTGQGSLPATFYYIVHLRLICSFTKLCRFPINTNGSDKAVKFKIWQNNPISKETYSNQIQYLFYPNFYQCAYSKPKRIQKFECIPFNLTPVDARLGLNGCIHNKKEKGPNSIRSF